MTTQRDAAFYMADIRNKRPTRRRAVAVGEFLAGAAAFATVVERRLRRAIRRLRVRRAHRAPAVLRLRRGELCRRALQGVQNLLCHSLTSNFTFSGN